MGAWGVGTFENDDALDLLSAVDEAKSVKPIAGALTEAISSEYLEAPEASASLAAAELVAAALGRPMPNAPELAEKVFKKFTKIPPPQIVEVAQVVTARVLTESELSELWEESGSSEEWSATVKDLIERLA